MIASNNATSDGREGVLVVEDSMIIAMDTEEMLHQIGFSKVVVAGNVAMALDELERFDPQFALLDYNLGESSSEEVAQCLTQRGIPFWFVTGYGDAVDQLSSSKARGVLQKPFVQEDLERVAGILGAETGGA